MINKGRALAAVLVTAVASSSGTYWATSTVFKKKNELDSLNSPCASECKLNVHRLGGFSFIKPLQYAEPAYESSKYATLKSKLSDYINQKKKEGGLTRASVYLRDFKNSDWMSLNASEAFHPGSLIKLPILISYLKLSEKQPGLLKERITYVNDMNIPVQTFNSKQIKPGKTYSIVELLTYMIAYSDNNATYELKKHLSVDEFKATFNQVGLPVPDIMDPNFSVSAKDFSTFYKILYNVGFLSNENSEYAMQILSKCDFTQGMVAGLPANTPIAHKFGEWGNATTHELHESGIIYIDGEAYVLTIMTAGLDINKLATSIKDITAIFDQEMDNPSIANMLFNKK